MTHLQERRPLLVLVHLGGQALELGGHVAHAHKDLVLAGLLGAAAQRALQLLQLGQQVGVLGGQRLQVLGREGDELGSEGFREQRGAPRWAVLPLAVSQPHSWLLAHTSPPSDGICAPQRHLP